MTFFGSMTGMDEAAGDLFFRSLRSMDEIAETLGRVAGVSPLRHRHTGAPASAGVNTRGVINNSFSAGPPKAILKTGILLST